jgi:GST-like protein
MKVVMILEEANLSYAIYPMSDLCEKILGSSVPIQMPTQGLLAIIDTNPADAGVPIVVVEAGAVLFYFARKEGILLPSDIREKTIVTEWIIRLAKVLKKTCLQQEYLKFKFSSKYEKYVIDLEDFCKSLNSILKDRRFIAGDKYSIADIAAYPWVHSFCSQGNYLHKYDSLKLWLETVGLRPATLNAYSKAALLFVDNQPPRKVAKAIEYICDNFNSDLNIDDIAKYACSSVRSLQLSFKAYKHITPMRYLREVRLCYAREQLLDNVTDLCWQQISIRAGFTDFNSFSKYYKEKFGETPFRTRMVCKKIGYR